MLDAAKNTVDEVHHKFLLEEAAKVLEELERHGESSEPAEPSEEHASDNSSDTAEFGRDTHSQMTANTKVPNLDTEPTILRSNPIEARSSSTIDNGLFRHQVTNLVIMGNNGAGMVELQRIRRLHGLTGF